MLNFTTNRTITVEGGAIPRRPDGGAALILHRIKGEEILSKPYQYRLELVTALDMPNSEAANLDLQAMVGRELTTIIQLDGGSETREISGIVTKASLTKRLTHASLNEKPRSRYLYKLVLEPWIVLAKRRTDYRIFQKKTVVEIIDEVLSSQYLYVYEKRLSQTYLRLRYEVQYGESDYDFIQRLMERSGIYWFFEHSDGIHRMVLVDGMGAHRSAPGEAYRLLSYYPAGHRAGQEYISHFDIAEHIQSGTWVTDDFDFTKPWSDLTVQHAHPKKTPYNQLAIYEWPGNYTDPEQGAAYARVRMEDIRARGKHASGRGNLRGVVCGTTFTLSGYPQDAANCTYLVTRSRLDAEERGETSSSGKCRFSADFDVQQVTIPYRPERKTRLPRTTGPQTAIVTGPPGQEIWTDLYGRVKLKFHWDHTSICDQNSSCWVRVSYPWAGSNFGGVNLPRVGTEVIVDFENGDPNRPIITGRVYNAMTMPPWELPGNATQSGLISRSIGGALENANALRFEDLAGMEEVWLQAERDMLSEIKNNEEHIVGVNRSKTIGANETTQIGGTRTETVKGDEMISLQSNRSRSVQQDDTLNIGGNQTTAIKGDQKHTVENNRDRSVGNDDSLSVKGSRKVAIQQNHTLAVSGDQSIQIDKGQTVRVQQDVSVSAGQSATHSAQQSLTLQCGQASISLHNDGTISINGQNIKISGSNSVEISGDTVDLN